MQRRRITSRRSHAPAVLLLASVLLAEPAHAYVDPGTGSFILQFLLALFFGIAFTLRRAWRSLLRTSGKADDAHREADTPVEPQ